MRRDVGSIEYSLRTGLVIGHVDRVGCVDRVLTGCVGEYIVGCVDRVLMGVLMGVLIVCVGGARTT